MNTYGRIDINLLPPEMQPGPMVRYGLLINVAVATLTLAFILINLYLGWVKLDLEREDLAQLQAGIDAQAYIEDDYNRLAGLGNKLSQYGSLIAYASLDYVDMPVVLDRLSKIIPDGVYLASVSNRGTTGENVDLVVMLKSSDNSTDQIYQTLVNFKHDSIFANCYLPAVAFDEEPLDDLMARSGINWSVGGPDVDMNVISQQFDFQIHSRLNRPLPGVDLPTVMDDLPYFASLGLESSTNEQPADGTPPEGTADEEVK